MLILNTPLGLVLHIVAHHFIAIFMLKSNCIFGYVEAYRVHFTRTMSTESAGQMLTTVFLIYVNDLLISLPVVAVAQVHVALFCFVVLASRRHQGVV